MSKKNKGKCFIISPIGDENSKGRKQSDEILKKIIKPAAQKCGYRIIRADKFAKPGLITKQIIQHLIEDPLVIADLTDKDPNVLYELAIRHVLKKPVVQIIKKGQTIPFDVQAIRTIFFKYDTPKNTSKYKNELIKQIQSVENNPSDVDVPFSTDLFPDTKLYTTEKEINKYMLSLVSSGSTLDIVSNQLHWINEDGKIKSKIISRAKSGRINIYIPKPNDISKELKKRKVRIHICPELGMSPHPRFTLVNKDRPGTAMLAIASGRIPKFLISEFDESIFSQVVSLAREYVNSLKAK